MARHFRVEASDAARGNRIAQDEEAEDSAVGDLEARTVGPRSRVWSEPSMVDAGAREFEVIAAHNFADLRRDATWLAAATYLAEISSLLEDAESARVVYLCLFHM